MSTKNLFKIWIAVYRHLMPNKRAAGQKLINVPVDENFLTQMDSAIEKTDYSNRSEFIRAAIVEKLKSEGFEIPASLAKPPARAGKNLKYPPHQPNHYVVNEPSSKSKAATREFFQRRAKAQKEAKG